jgi:hypothetical protein
MVYQRSILGKTLSLTVILIFVGVTVQPAIADIAKEHHILNSNSNNLYEIVNGKPDLIITNIFFREINIPPGPGMSINIRIRNIGDEKVDENEDIKISILVNKWNYITYKTIDIAIEGGLKPGKWKEECIDLDWNYLPGFHRFICTVNINKTIEESNYLNNEYSERAYHSLFFDFWMDLTFL